MLKPKLREKTVMRIRRKMQSDRSLRAWSLATSLAFSLACDLVISIFFSVPTINVSAISVKIKNGSMREYFTVLSGILIGKIATLASARETFSSKSSPLIGERMPLFLVEVVAT